MSASKTTKNISTMVQAIATFVSDVISVPAKKAKKGKIQLVDLTATLQDDDFITNLTELVKDNMPKPQRVVGAKTFKPKDPDAPKKPRSAYLLFCDDNRVNIKTDLANKVEKSQMFSETSKVLGAKWKKLSTNKKAPYQKKAAELKEEYDAQMKDYEAPTYEELMELEDNIKAKKRWARTHNPDGTKKAPKKKKDPNAPKRARSAYIFFSQEKRSDIKNKHPDATPTEIMRKLGEKWSKIKDTKKANKYKTMADEDKERYAREKEAYTPLTSDAEASNTSDSDKSNGAPTPKKKSSRKHKALEPEPKNDDSDDSSDEEEKKSSPRKSPRKHKAPEPEPKNDDSDDSSDEEEKKSSPRKSLRKRKVSVTLSKPKEEEASKTKTRNGSKTLKEVQAELGLDDSDSDDSDNE